MEFNSYSDSGRTLFVEFKCRRCGATHYEPLKQANERSGNESYGYLHNINIPPEWSKIAYGTIVREKCAKAYVEFMQGGSGNG